MAIFIKGTGKTRTICAAVEHIVRSTGKNVLVCTNSNSACDEVAERVLRVLGQSQIFRLYAKSYKKSSLKPELENICNLQNGQFQFPPLEYLYKFRVLVCTLLTAGLLVRANGADEKFNAKHFSHIIIDESACTHESTSLIPIAGTLSIKYYTYIIKFDCNLAI